MNLVLIAGLAVAASAAANPPHVFLVVGDDMGWASVGWHNPNNTHTPNMNAIVKNEGIELDRHYGEWVSTAPADPITHTSLLVLYQPHKPASPLAGPGALQARVGKWNRTSMACPNLHNF